MPSSETVEDTLNRFKALEKELINSEVILNYANNKPQMIFNLRPGHVEEDQQKVIEYLTLLEQLNGQVNSISEPIAYKKGSPSSLFQQVGITLTYENLNQQKTLVIHTLV